MSGAADRSPPPRSISFEGERRALLVEGVSGTDARLVMSRLSLHPGNPVIVLSGGADSLTGIERDRARKLLGQAIVRAAHLTGALVVDGGTDAGVIALLGAAAERSDWRPTLIGVAPEGLVTYPGAPGSDGGVELEPNHSHFVLVPGTEWGEETNVLIELAARLAGSAPVVVVVAGGGDVTEIELAKAARRGWPIYVLQGTGGVSDQLVSLEHQPSKGATSALEEVAAAGNVHTFEEDAPDQLARLLAWELQDLKVLKRAWVAFASYDQAASRLRKSFERFQWWILVLGIAATFVALIKSEIESDAQGAAGFVDTVLHWAVVATPIVVASLIALANRVSSGKRWVLLRAGAEAIKREIYRFRTETGIYATGDQSSRQAVLASQLDVVESRLMSTEVSAGSIPRYAGTLPPKMYGASRYDDGLSSLTGERYLEIRVEDQLAYFYPKTEALHRKQRRLQALAIAAGGVGTLLAAAGFEVWIGLTTAISVASIAHLGYLQVDATLVAYNHAAARLEALVRSWEALPPERRDRNVFEQLVSDAESALEGELGGWVQQMSEALRELQARQEDARRRSPRVEEPDARKTEETFPGST